MVENVDGLFPVIGFARMSYAVAPRIFKIPKLLRYLGIGFEGVCLVLSRLQLSEILDGGLGKALSAESAHAMQQ